MTVYYNEIDEKAAAWLRELIRRDLIAPGDVDTRSIEDVSPDDLRPYTQCHFFAGIGVWSYALRLAGWPDDRPVWTGSCPCQPFSAAGKGSGFTDERHLWPAMLHLIRERRPVVWLGEQVASKDGLGWLDLVQADLEGEGYAVGAGDTCSAGFGAPHIRQRLRIAAQRVADADRGQLGRLPGFRGPERDGPDTGWAKGRGSAAACGDDGRVEYPELPAQPRQRPVSGATVCEQDAAGLAGAGVADGLDGDAGDTGLLRQQAASAGAERPGPVNGFWRAADWLFCRDGKWRPVEPGSFPLAHGSPARVGRLRGYGNAVDAIATKEFIEAAAEAFDDLRLMSDLTTDEGIFG